MKKNKYTLTLIVFFLFSGFNLGFCNDLSFDFTMIGTTKYLWRGQKLYDKYCFQPNLNINLENFTFNYWASYPFEKENYLESDFTFFAYDTMPYIDVIQLNAGCIIYTFPNSSKETKNSLEIFAGISLDTLFTPYMKLYYDAVLGKGYFLEGGISYNIIKLDSFASNLYASTGYNFNQWNYSPSFTALFLIPEFIYSLSLLDIMISSNIQISLSDQYNNDYAVNIGIKYTYK
ncbi:MAG: hypothetical protein KA120_03595 [Candidatus Goldbacteria bacterium]|nr:hypothetical protein [Candidatus Goldiibacteriota bacterium]